MSKVEKANGFVGKDCTINGNPAMIGPQVNGWYQIIAYGQVFIYASAGLVIRAMTTDCRFSMITRGVPAVIYAG